MQKPRQRRAHTSTIPLPSTAIPMPPPPAFMERLLSISADDDLPKEESEIVNTDEMADDAEAAFREQMKNRFRKEDLERERLEALHSLSVEDLLIALNMLLAPN